MTLTVASGLEERTLEAAEGQSVLEVLRGSGFFVDAPCGGRGSCGKCGVQIDGKWRSACGTRAAPGMRIVVPSAASYFATRTGGDVQRRLRELGAQRGGGASRGNRGAFGIAMDLGTTTVSMALIDMDKAAVAGSVSFYNPQIMYGADVISRIVYSLGGNGRAVLKDAIVSETGRAILHLCAESGVSPDSVGELVMAGNTTMQHLFLGLEARFIREEPFHPIMTVFPVRPAAEFFPGLSNAELHLLPCVANYLGADMVAGTAACGIHDRDGLSVLLDIGTNGEIVLGTREWLMGCACSAGPAFEGVGLGCGMRYKDGAVTDARVVDGRIEYSVAGGGSPAGISGVGAIGLVAALREAGFIDERGRFTERVSDSVGSRRAFILHGQGPDGRIYVDEPDIDNIIRAKAAIFAGMRTMLKGLSLGFSDISRVHVAGGIGSALMLDKAVKLGLLPRLDQDRVSFDGNTSLQGAIYYLISERFRGEVSAIQRMTTYMDLGGEPGYMDEYMAALFIPHTDRRLFQE